MRKLTKREKVLITLLLVLTVLYGSINFLIAPAFKTMGEKELRRDGIALEKLMVEGKVNSEDSLRKIFEKSQVLHEELSRTFIKLLPNEDVDKSIITSTCLENGLKPQFLSIKNELFYKDGIKGEKKTTAFSTEENSTPAILNLAVVTVNSTGDDKNLRQFIDGIAGKEYIVIKKATYSAQGRSSTGARTPTIDLIVEVSMEESSTILGNRY